MQMAHTVQNLQALATAEQRRSHIRSQAIEAPCGVRRQGPQLHARLPPGAAPAVHLPAQPRATQIRSMECLAVPSTLWVAACEPLSSTWTNKSQCDYTHVRNQAQLQQLSQANHLPPRGHARPQHQRLQHRTAVRLPYAPVHILAGRS